MGGCSHHTGGIGVEQFRSSFLYWKRVPSRTARVFSEITLLGFALSAAAALFLGWLAVEVLDGDTVRFDNFVRGAVHSWASPLLTVVMKLFTLLGSGYALGVIVLAALLIFWEAGSRRSATILAITVAGAFILEQVLKAAFHRARPVPYFGLAAPDSFSFPSGHALLSFACFATLAALIAPGFANHRARVVIWTAAVIVIAMIGLSRVYLGVHYPTDVIAGYLTGFIWVFAVSRGDHYLRNRQQSRLPGSGTPREGSPAGI